MNRQNEVSGASAAKAPVVIIAATFTADPVREPLEFWLEQVHGSTDLRFAPYSQVMQQLLDPHSQLATNRAGVNVLMIRVEDWIRDRLASEEANENIAHIQSMTDELASAFETFRLVNSAPAVIYLAPSSESRYESAVRDAEELLLRRLSACVNAHVSTHADLTNLYPVVMHEDARADRLGHIPYSTEYFVALGTLLARRIAALTGPTLKVIVIDCDNTLWGGICGEVGAEGVDISEPYRQFQQMLVRQHDAGMLLCLCSKNNPSDVEAVFRSRPDMVLGEEHVICSRINWEPKSQNLRSLAKELDLSLDSFVFLDDSDVECAEVLAHCPSVLTLNFPGQAAAIADFLRHTWVFDRVGVTKDGKRRTAQYRENSLRARERERATDLQTFLASLQLQVDISVAQAVHLPRVAELVQRTNQFNLNGLRRSYADIEAVHQSKASDCLVVHVRDRFGDYGLVGALLIRRDQTVLHVDTFVLSCRVLGRGVEHRIVNELGRIARDARCDVVSLHYRPTDRNTPARQFLEQSISSRLPAYGDVAESSREFTVSLSDEWARGVVLSSAVTFDAEEESQSEVIRGSKEAPNRALGWVTTCTQLSRVPDIMTAIERAATARSPAALNEFRGRSALEESVGELFAAVLRRRDFNSRSDFFAIGGDSLAAVRVIARVGSILGLELSIQEFLDSPTVQAVAQKLEHAIPMMECISHEPLDAQQPLSLAQQRIWFTTQLEGSSDAYHIPLVLSLKGKLDVDALRAALAALLRRHDSLRTKFVDVGGTPYQVIVEEASFPLRRIDLERTSDVAIGLEISEEMGMAFDLSAAPLIRGRLLRVSDSEHVLAIVMHHLVSDGWSTEILLEELAEFYRASTSSCVDPLPPTSLRYVDYALWQKKWLARAELDSQVAFWNRHLQGAPQLLELPTDKARPAVRNFRGSTVESNVDPILIGNLRALASRMNMTLAMTLYAAWAIVLSRLSGQEDIVIGMPVANRRRTEFEGVVGLFVNTLAIRVRVEGDSTVAEILRQLKETLLASYANQDAPFERVVEALRPARSLSHSPVFQAMLVLQSRSGTLELPGLTIRREPTELQTAQFDLTLSLQETAEGGLHSSLNYATDLFERDTIKRWSGYFQEVIGAMVADQTKCVSRIALMSAGERATVLEGFNSTDVNFPQSRLLVHELFDEQAERTPDAPAVTFGTEVLTYEQLRWRADRLADYLRWRGVGPDRMVGICVERSLEMVVGLLGILKAGGAYVPLDPMYPRERLAYMLSDASPEILLTQQRLKDSLPGGVYETLCLDSQWDLIAQSPRNARSLQQKASSLAYMIYTSGSTGKPKGAMNEHRAVVNRLLWMQKQYQMGPDDSVLQKTPFSFDVSVWEFFWTLATGARLVVAEPGGHQDPQYLRRIIEQESVTTLHFVPSMLQAFLGHLGGGECPTLKHIVCSGEELSVQTQNNCLALLPAAKLSNLYGPTEAAIDVTSWECSSDNRQSRVPIGFPIANTRMYVLDRDREPVPIGVSGEVYIGGTGVGRGYHGRAELTAEKFVPDPSSPTPGARLYRTGDLGRWRADGAIEYLGRNDFQVKLRGLRIELGEIENQLTKHPLVREGVVTVREDVAGDKRLVAYVVLRERPDASDVADTLRIHLRGSLPEYMVPAAVVVLEGLPVTPNGKLDRNRLPAPSAQSYSARSYEPPQGDVEQILARIWADLLKRESVGRRDNFFELGGHSLMIVAMMGRLRKEGLSAQIRSVFDSPTLADLATEVYQENTASLQAPPNVIPADCISIAPQMLPLIDLSPEQIRTVTRSVPGGARNIQDIYPLVPAQEGILFHHLINGAERDAYVASTLLLIESSEKLASFKAALQKVIDRHDVLRTAVLWEQLPKPLQVVYRHADLVVEEVNLDSDRDVGSDLVGRSHTLKLQEAPLLRLRIAAAPQQGQWYALLLLHHIVGDNVSRDLVVAELLSLMQGREAAQRALVPYREFVWKSLCRAASNADERFFQEQFSDVVEPTVPFGLADVYGDGDDIRESHQVLDPTISEQVRAQARRLGVSAATLFHAAWGLVVACATGRDDVVFGSVLLGRLGGASATHDSIGMFINTLPLRLKLRGLTVRQLVEETNRGLAELLSNEQASLAVAQRCSGIGGSGSLFTAVLNYRQQTQTGDSWGESSGIRQLSSHDRTNYPVTVSVDDSGSEFSSTAQTVGSFDARRITRYLHNSLQSLVTALSEAAETLALNIRVLPADEQHQLLVAFNQTSASYPQERTVVQLFEERAAARGSALAASDGSKTITYEDLNAQSNRLARHLAELGIRPGDYVPVLMARSLDMLIVQIAVLKAGGVYVPLDPELPQERRAFVLRDCAARLLVCDEELERTADGIDWIVYAEAAIEMTRYSPLSLDLRMSSDSPAYVMYTSGSTGVPKGVVVQHRAINCLIINNGYARIQPEDRISYCSNPAFDASTFEIWGALLSGACVVIVPHAVVMEASSLAAMLVSERVTILWLTIGLFTQYADELADVFPRMKYVMTGGDVVDPALMRRVLSRGAPQHLLSAYGPTECTTFSTMYSTENLSEDARSVPIGRPIANTRIYILDPQMQPVPVGVTGEMYIGGDGVALGYLNRPELTSLRFLADPFSKDSGARLYRTGDIARWRADGNIDFIGRNDAQVKIRGYRIELGEIEEHVLRHASVREAVVLAREDSPGDKRLVAYVTVRDGSTLDPLELRAELKDSLPEYMVPGAIVVMNTLPLNSSGKLDRRALPEPDSSAFATQQYEAPSGEIEESIAGIWRELLRLDRVGRHDDFFEIGGHSLLATRVMTHIDKELDVRLPLRSLFDSPTIEGLAARVMQEFAADLDLAVS